MDDLLAGSTPASVALATVVIDELAALGVTDVVCCPGSRSAPLAYACARVEAEGRIRLHMRLDERSAGFFALGLAKASGRATPVITTSGTAVANLAPAMAEARFAQVPLVAVTADRPSTLVGMRANQTADQVGIFGTTPLAVVRVSSADGSYDGWRAQVRRVVVTADGRLSRRPGPVHLNVELTAPLIGEPEAIPRGVPFRVEPIPPGGAVRLDAGPRTVIVAGDMPVEQGRWWAQAADQARIPLLAEPSSNARWGSAAVSGYRYLLPGFASQIERVVVTGHPTLSRPVTSLLSRTDIDIVAVDSSGEWSNPGWATSCVAPAVRLAAGDPGWLDRWTAADQWWRQMVDAASSWSPAAAVTGVWGQLGAQDVLVLGASNPIRDADIAPIGSVSPQVYANRGLSGIDGTIATACGIAAHHGQPVVAYLGDLTALHDISSLAVPRHETTPDVTVVVADDQGGSLFSTLEYGAARSSIGEMADWFERLFALPMAVDVAAVARGFGVPVTTATSSTALIAALQRRGPGLSVVVASLERADRATRHKQLSAWGRQAVRSVTS
ncbi:MAG: 2-succinyl-5-enolpyruvyl-6-hydroxy-3-cyclohexene-1-carboxylic-acid synthase [Propionibacteriaceae bacterium]|jgi:2-succinyl-5-enolpyruvyl-6-hydroxy-3-cyclohexene-1-carboxylate synthase|nr:2-succinyl-5-enolpyruvyl-6-hydroxy-3-cyclohexene-1-carboxylic-acid synthase [Propionibacteriaceae bacterium]